MNPRYLLFIFTFFLISCSDSRFSKKKIKEVSFKKEKNYDYYFQEGKLDSAKIYIEELYNKEPNDKNILVNRGDVYFLLNDFEVAEESWLKCVSLDLKDEVCYEKLTNLYCVVDGLMGENCYNIISKTLKINEDNKIALFYKAKRFSKENNINNAIKLYEKLLKEDPNNLMLLNELALLYEPSSLESKMYYNKMVKIDSNYVGFYGLGLHFQKNQLFENAIENYNNALIIEKNKNAYYNIGYCYLEMDFPDKAIDFFSKVINIDPSHVLAYYGRGYSYSLIKKNKLAIEDYKFCLMLEPGFEDARNQLEKIK